MTQAPDTGDTSATLEKLRKVQDDLQQSEGKYRQIFDSVGVSLWEQDFTQVKSLLDDLRSQGVRDLRQHLHNHPEVVRAALQSIKLRDANQRALKLFGAKSKAEFLASVALLFGPESERDFIEKLVVLAEGRRFWEAETVLRTLQGRRLTVLFTLVFPQKSDGYDYALVSLHDITQRKQAEQALRENEARFRLLAEAGRGLAASLEFKDRLQALADAVVPSLADWCAVHVVDGQETLRLIAAAHKDPAKTALIAELARCYPVSFGEAGGTAQVLRSGRPEIGPSDSATPGPALADAERASRLRELGFASWMIVPLAARGRRLGTYTLARGEPGPRYEQADLSLAQELAARAALEIDNARLFEEEQKIRLAAQRASGRTARLQAATAAFSRALTPRQVAEVIVREGAWLLGTRPGVVTLFAGEGWEFESAPNGSQAQSPAPAEQTVRLAAPVPAVVAAHTSAPIWAESYQALETRHPQLAQALGPERDGAVALLPLTIEERALGVMALRFGEAREFDSQEREFLLALAGLCAQALDRARLYEAEQAARAEAQALNAKLEERVSRRTRQLLEANASLEREIAERKQIESRLHASQLQLRNLAIRLQTVREAERAQFAYQIHDEFGQSMMGLKMDVAWLNRNLGSAEPEVLAQKAAAALEQIDAAIRSVRRIAADLRPGILDDLGLAAAIEWETREFERRTGVRCKLVVGVDEVPLDAGSATAAFRIFQEILSNVRRHALASRVIITLNEAEGQVVLAVRDNGRSISKEKIASPDSLGLIAMRELAQSRAGDLHIVGQPGKGTTVTLRLPIQRRVS